MSSFVPSTAQAWMLLIVAGAIGLRVFSGG
jgi:hypothetical protein